MVKQYQNKIGHEGDYSDNLRHIGEDIVDSLHVMGEDLSNPDAPALTDEMRARASRAAKRSLGVKITAQDNDIAGMESKAEDLGMYYEETGLEPGVGKALDDLRTEHHGALVDKLNRHPEIPTE